MQQYAKPFIIRAKVSFNNVVKAFVASNETDSVVTFVAQETETFNEETLIKGTLVKVRLVKITLPNGTIEVLITSLFDDSVFTIDVLNELYRLRWKIETAYDRLKNQLLIMIFSGLKPEAIYQEIYATIFVHNLQKVFINEAQNTVNELTINCENEYIVNQNVATGIFKCKIFPLFKAKKTDKIIKELLRIMAKKRVAKSKIKATHPRKKSLAKRRNLVTQLNYKRAG